MRRRYWVSRVGKANRIDFLHWTPIKVENFHIDACRPDDRIKDRLYADMLDLLGKRIDLVPTILVDRVIDDVRLVHVWVAPHPRSRNKLYMKSGRQRSILVERGKMGTYPKVGYHGVGDGFVIERS